MSLDRLTEDQARKEWSEVLPEDECNAFCHQGRRVGHVCKQHQPSEAVWRFWSLDRLTEDQARKEWSEVLPEDECNAFCHQGRRVGHVCKQHQPSEAVWRFCDRAIAALLAGIIGFAVISAMGVLQ